MRNAMICAVLMLCSILALGQGQPQWTVVQHVTLSQQLQPIPQTTLLTPTEPGIYRITVYFSGGNETGSSGWSEVLNGTDITGAPLGGVGDLNIPCRGANWSFTFPITISLEPNVPLTYQVRAYSQVPSCHYNLAITVEQLM